MVRKVISLFLMLLLSGNILAEKVESFAAGKAMAASTNKPLLLDFMTDWWGSCKRFARAAEEDEEVKSKLDEVILVQIDSEKGEGIELAKKYGIRGYPTFILANAEGEAYYRWMGYSKEYFFKKMETGMSDLTTITEKRKRFAEKPDAKTAAMLAEYSASKAEYKEAIAMYSRAAEMDEDNDFAYELYENYSRGMRRDLFSMQELMAAADAF